MTTWNALGDYGLTVARASYAYRRNGAVSINVFTFVFQVFCLQVSFLSGFLSSEDIRSYGYLLSQRKYKSFESSLYDWINRNNSFVIGPGSFILGKYSFVPGKKVHCR